MLLWSRRLVPSELDLDFKIVPKNKSKIGPKSISRGIPARSRLQWRFLKRLRHLQARFPGPREVDFVYLITKQRTSLSYLQATVVAIMQTTERAVTAIAVAPPWDHLLRWLTSDKTYLRHKFQRCQFGIFLANASCLSSYSERICDKFSVSVCDMFVLNIDASIHPGPHLPRPSWLVHVYAQEHTSTYIYIYIFVYIYIYTYLHTIQVI